jgi:hypothetical protein
MAASRIANAQRLVNFSKVDAEKQHIGQAGG